MNITNEVRQYALGVQDIAKYKKMMGNPPNDGSYIKIDWTSNVLEQFRTKLFKRLRQPIKNHLMVIRLKRR